MNQLEITAYNQSINKRLHISAVFTGLNSWLTEFIPTNKITKKHIVLPDVLTKEDGIEYTRVQVVTSNDKKLEKIFKARFHKYSNSLSNKSNKWGSDTNYRCFLSRELNSIEDYLTYFDSDKEDCLYFRRIDQWYIFLLTKKTLWQMKDMKDHAWRYKYNNYEEPNSSENREKALKKLISELATEVYKEIGSYVIEWEDSSYNERVKLLENLTREHLGKLDQILKS
jgi:hypothetical protein